MEKNELYRIVELSGSSTESLNEWANSGDHVDGEPKQFPDGISTLGTDVDLSLRRYLDANGQVVKVQEAVYPDYSVEDLKEAYAAFGEQGSVHDSETRVDDVDSAQRYMALGRNDTDNSWGEPSNDSGDLFDLPEIEYDNSERDQPSMPTRVNSGDINPGLRMGRADADEIRAAQSALGITADGIVGPQTRRAVMDFQRERGLQVDGIMGDQTRTALRQMIAANNRDRIQSPNMMADSYDRNNMVSEKDAKPDYIDLDDDGDTEESMKKAAKDADKDEKVEENADNIGLSRIITLAGINK